MSDDMLDSPDDMKLSEIESLVNFCSRFGHHSTLEPLMQACHGGGVHSGGRRSRRHDGGDKHLKDGLMGRVKNPHVNGTARDFNCPQMDGITEQLQAAALTTLKADMMELAKRLDRSERDRDALHKKLFDAIEEKESSNRRLEAIGAAHESRITEMHCVIVELRKKLNAKQESAIVEENETEGSISELSFQEGSVYNSDMECTNHELESQTEPLDTRLVPQIHAESHHSTLSRSPAPLQRASSTQIEALQEEILHLRAQIALLQSQLATRKDDKNEETITADAADDDEHEADATEPPTYDNYQQSPRDQRSNYASEDDTTTNVFQQDVAQPHENGFNRADDEICDSISPVVQLLESLSCLNKATLIEMPITKKAERVRLRKTIADDNIEQNQQMFKRPADYGPEMTHNQSSDMCSTTIAEHLVADILVPGPTEANDLENEWKRMLRRIDSLKAQNSVLCCQLAESKANCEQLYLLCGQYESNAVALHLALNCSDRAIEAYDVMLALLESKNADSSESRRAAELVARHLLERLERENNLDGHSLGPWHEAIVICPDEGIQTPPWSAAEDTKLRSHVSKLKGQRAAIQNTVVNLESPFCFDKDSKECGDETGPWKHDKRRMELEMAVLMQELMNVREEWVEFKGRIDATEREKVSTIKRCALLQEAVTHLQAQLAESEAILAIANKDRTSFSEAEHSASIERELVEALARESRLKARLQELAGSLETAARSSEEKYIQVKNTVAELKRSNVHLTEKLERCKRKLRLRRLEQQLLVILQKQKTELPPASHQLTSQSTNSTPTTTTSSRLSPRQPQLLNTVPETTL